MRMGTILAHPRRSPFSLESGALGPAKTPFGLKPLKRANFCDVM
jgi:hypothetical protein